MLRLALTKPCGSQYAVTKFLCPKYRGVCLTSSVISFASLCVQDMGYSVKGKEAIIKSDTKKTLHVREKNI